MSTLNNVVLFVLVLFVLSFGSVACDFDDNGGGGSSPTSPTTTTPPTPTTQYKRDAFECLDFNWNYAYGGPGQGSGPYEFHWFILGNTCDFYITVEWAAWGERHNSHSITLGPYNDWESYWEVPRGRERGAFGGLSFPCVYRTYDSGEPPC